MKFKPFFKKSSAVFLILNAVILISFFQGCKDDDSTVNQPSTMQSDGHVFSGLSQVNLVADVSAYNPARIDPLLVNAWGIAVSPIGSIWISAEGTGVSPVYDTAGNNLLPAVTIPGASGPGEPTGQVFNPTTNFRIAGVPSRFLFASGDGTISGWTTGASAVMVINNSASNAVYTGIAIASLLNRNLLFAADFHNSKIDVFDSAFAHVISIPLEGHPMVPNRWGPFNIVNIANTLFVTFAQKSPTNPAGNDPGTGRGIVLVFSTDGSFIRPFAIRGPLNAPWAVVKTTVQFDGGEHILIGNSGDGRINVYTLDGHLRGFLRDGSNRAIEIDGLWGLSFVQTVPDRLYFASGPDNGQHGLFGYLKR